jgi:hypothetical protein
MNEHEIQRIAAAANQLRPDWPATSIATLIRKHLAERPRRDVAVALAWIACEANTATPKRILEAGPWWKAAGTEGSTTVREPFDPDTACDICSQRMHPDTDHTFESVTDANRRRHSDAPKPSLRELVAAAAPPKDADDRPAPDPANPTRAPRTTGA